VYESASVRVDHPLTDVQIPSKAHLTAVASDGSSAGGLLTAGTLSTQTPGTYTLSGTAKSFTMSTTKGACAVSGAALTCGSGAFASTFSAASDGAGGALLAYQGSSAFSSDDTPSGSTVETVYTGAGHSVTFSLAITST
jgi:ribonuclease T2